MGMPIRELLLRMDSRELSEWMAYEEIDPFGNERIDIGPAMICATLANINRYTKKRRKPFSVSDFLPRFGPQSKKQTKQQSNQTIKNICKFIHHALGGK